MWRKWEQIFPLILNLNTRYIDLQGRWWPGGDRWWVADLRWREVDYRQREVVLRWREQQGGADSLGDAAGRGGGLEGGAR